jgi:alpha-tubulin suppressor-like RCC1 family protein
MIALRRSTSLPNFSPVGSVQRGWPLLLVAMMACHRADRFPPSGMLPAPIQHCDSGTCGPAAGAIPSMPTTPRGADAAINPSPAACTHDSGCDDKNLCNGRERCAPDEDSDAGTGRCVTATAAVVCPADLRCDGATGQCTCRFDLNGDGRIAQACGGPDCDDDDDGDSDVLCGGTDCDDHDKRRSGKFMEVCDLDGHDEDCNLETVAAPWDRPDAQRDADHDGAASNRCSNRNPVTGEIYQHGDDCNDGDPNVKPGADEICNDADDDCDGFIDEERDTSVSYGLRRTFYPDRDQDEWADLRSAPLRSCFQPRGYIEVPDDAQADCNDDPLKRGRDQHPDLAERCDGLDNDCDHQVDETNQTGVTAMIMPYVFEDTRVICSHAAWVIPPDGCPADKLWCNTATVEHGCETDATNLRTCHACKTDCKLSCGQKGCDEVRDVSVGEEHVCVVTREGRVACWGRNTEGRLGNDSLVGSAVAVPVVGLRDVVQVVAGTNHSCVIVGAERAVYCWGSNAARQLGSPELNAYNPVPVSVTGLSTDRMRDIHEVSVGLDYSCACATSGEVFCWGERGNGRLGDNAASNSTGPVSPRKVQIPNSAKTSGFDFVSDATSVRSGYGHTCILRKDGSVSCWGDNRYGQIGDPALSGEFAAYARAVPGVSDVVQLTAGNNHTCVLTKAGRVLCWGANGHLQLGRPSDTHDGQASPVEGLQDPVAISAGYNKSCALQRDHKVLCWGSGIALGVDEQDISPAILPVDATREVSAGGIICTVDGADLVRCTGDNFFGELGRGTTSQVLEPFGLIKPVSTQ